MSHLFEREPVDGPRSPSVEQDQFASRLLAELLEEDELGRTVAATSDRLASLAEKTLAEFGAGLTVELDRP